jgi:hypothetical protein
VPVVGRGAVAASVPVVPRAQGATGMMDAVCVRPGGYFNSSVTLAGEAGAASTETAVCSAERI